MGRKILSLIENVSSRLKMCIRDRYTPVGGSVYCTYSQNLLYTEIMIWDEGDGFAAEDTPDVYKRQVLLLSLRNR